MLAAARAILGPAAAQTAADTAGPRRGSWAAEAEAGGGVGVQGTLVRVLGAIYF